MVKGLMTPLEIAEFKMGVRKSWMDTPLHILRSTVTVNNRLAQMIEIRNQVIEEIINERQRSDYKTHQYAD